MRHLRWTIVLYALVASSGSQATSEVPLTWSSVRVEAQEFGGAVAQITRLADGFLGSISVSVRDKAVKIEDGCLPNGFTVYLNNLEISYSELSGDIPVWDVEFGVDFPESVNGIGTYHLILLQDRIHSSYIEYPETERITAFKDICSFRVNST